MIKRLFHQKHPVITGLLVLAGIFVLSWAGITFFVSSFGLSDGDSDFLSPASFHGGVGVIELKGMIVSAEDVLRDLREFRKNRAIKAIVLRIDSPGGAVGASQEIYDEIRRMDKVKPVVASMGSVAASGGFYAALGAREIFASRGTLTGSIGVIIKFADLSEIFKKVGYKSEVIKSGKLKDIGSPNRPMTAEERRFMQALIDNVYNQFVEAVHVSRSLPVAKVKKFADGRVFSGEQAKELGLIDKFGNFNDAIRAAATYGGITNEFPRLIYPAGKKISLLKLLAGEQSVALFNRLSLGFPFLAYEWSIGPQ